MPPTRLPRRGPCSRGPPPIRFRNLSGRSMARLQVNFVEFASLPDVGGAAGAHDAARRRARHAPLFVNDMRGPLYSVSYDGKTVTPYLDINAPTGECSVQSQGNERGFQSFAFHPQFNQTRRPRLRQVLHAHRHEQHDSGGRLQARRRQPHARHGAARVDGEESRRRDLRRRTAARTDALRAAVREPQRRPSHLQSARRARRRRFRSALHRLRRRRQRRRSAEPCRRTSVRPSARFCASTRSARTAPTASTAFPPAIRSSATTTRARSAKSTPSACAIRSAFSGIRRTATCSSPTSARTPWKRSARSPPAPTSAGTSGRAASASSAASGVQPRQPARRSHG